ncbi:NAD-dependent epimerase/dehydratase family protein [Litoricolaceae bacterium]|nr:NAD-dependent epimerase/dehydratase family protein [Litorivicinaceae bacterium]
MIKSDILDVIEILGDDLNHLSDQQILLTGAGGFLGRYFLEVFSEAIRAGALTNISVTAIDNFCVGRDGAGDDVFDGGHSCEWLTWSQVNICDQSEVEKLGHFSVIIHAAGIASPFYYRASPLETLDVAVTGTRNLLELAKRFRSKFIFFSSSEIYGDPDPRHVPIKESYRGNVSCAGPRACYDESKRLGETLCYIYHEYFGVHTNVIRPFNIYGPSMGQNDYRVMPNFASNIAKGLPLEVYGNGSQTRTFCYISDALVGIFKIFGRGVSGEAYNLGTAAEEVSINDLAALIKEVWHEPVAVNVTEYPDTYPQDEPMRRCPDIKKIRLQLGYSPRVNLKQGVLKFLKWADQNYDKAR